MTRSWATAEEKSFVERDIPQVPTHLVKSSQETLTFAFSGAGLGRHGAKPTANPVPPLEGDTAAPRAGNQTCACPEEDFVIRLSTGAALGIAVAAAVATPLSAAAASPQSAPAQAPTSVTSAQANADKDHAALGLSKDEKLVVRNVSTDADGTQHVRYDRTFKGLRVLGGDLIVEKSKAGCDQGGPLQRLGQGGGRVDDPLA